MNDNENGPFTTNERDEFAAIKAGIARVADELAKVRAMLAGWEAKKRKPDTKGAQPSPDGTIPALREFMRVNASLISEKATEPSPGSVGFVIRVCDYTKPVIAIRMEEVHNLIDKNGWPKRATLRAWRESGVLVVSLKERQRFARQCYIAGETLSMYCFASDVIGKMAFGKV